jgi:membrane dipeptidase
VSKSGDLGIIMTMEGAAPLEGNLEFLKDLYRLGLRSLQLTWNVKNEAAAGIQALEHDDGLTKFGSDLIAEMNKLGILIDVSHLAPNAFWDVIAQSKALIIASHSNAWGLYEHQRNLDDQQITAIAENGGVVCVTAVPEFISPPSASIDGLLDHIDYLVNYAGIEHVGVGLDFMAFFQDIIATMLPSPGFQFILEGLEGPKEIPNLLRGLKQRNYDDDSIAKILAGNMISVLTEVLT